MRCCGLGGGEVRRTLGALGGFAVHAGLALCTGLTVGARLPICTGLPWFAGLAFGTRFALGARGADGFGHGFTVGIQLGFTGLAQVGAGLVLAVAALGGGTVFTRATATTATTRAALATFTSVARTALWAGLGAAHFDVACGFVHHAITDLGGLGIDLGTLTRTLGAFATATATSAATAGGFAIGTRCVIAVWALGAFRTVCTVARGPFGAAFLALTGFTRFAAFGIARAAVAALAFATFGSVVTATTAVAATTGRRFTTRIAGFALVFGLGCGRYGSGCRRGYHHRRGCSTKQVF